MKTYQLVIHVCEGVCRVQGGGVSARSCKYGKVGGLGFGLVRNHMLTELILE
jgi:hypothetical protein